MTSAEQDVAVVRGVYAAFGQGDPAAVLSRFAEDATVVQSGALPWGGTHRGRAGQGRFLAALTGHVESVPESQQLFPDGAGHVVQVGRTRGVVRATGAGFDVSEVHVWTVADGLVQRFEAYVDVAPMLAALRAPAAADVG